jgi:hypothetical protein
MLIIFYDIKGIHHKEFVLAGQTKLIFDQLAEPVPENMDGFYIHYPIHIHGVYCLTIVKYGDYFNFTRCVTKAVEQLVN